ncbi:MAG: AGE family epimerase/isomerase [Pirellulaceae bacterium]|nr:AGE family epimerase/isomerase [Pirellulaceae bacterium]
MDKPRASDSTPTLPTLGPERISRLIAVYRDGLLDDTLPFWLRHAPDAEHGGYFSALDRQGNVIDTDKAIWIQGRFAWLLSTLYVQVQARDEWLRTARSGIEFLLRHGFDSDGRMFFQVTRDGRPLRKRRYVYSEMFAVMALAAYAQAADDRSLAQRAEELFRSTTRLLTTAGALAPKVDPQSRPSRSFGVPMILLNTAQVLRDTLNSDQAVPWIDWSIEQIRRYHLNDQHRAVLETAGPDGELIDHYDGRMLNPGHAIEGAWFILREARHRGGDARLIELGTRMLDWMWAWGWDEQFGGILYFRDVRGLPVQEYWHDMKFWWPQNEAILATLFAFCLTGQPRFAQWHAQIHDWAYRHFPDAEYGEWYGYLHRDGRISSTAKGTMWKGPFHLPRMQLIGWRLLEDLAKKPRVSD